MQPCSALCPKVLEQTTAALMTEGVQAAQRMLLQCAWLYGHHRAMHIVFHKPEGTTCGRK